MKYQIFTFTVSCLLLITCCLGIPAPIPVVPESAPENLPSTPSQSSQEIIELVPAEVAQFQVIPNGPVVEELVAPVSNETIQQTPAQDRITPTLLIGKKLLLKKLWLLKSTTIPIPIIKGPKIIPIPIPIPFPKPFPAPVPVKQEYNNYQPPPPPPPQIYYSPPQPIYSYSQEYAPAPSYNQQQQYGSSNSGSYSAPQSNYR